MKKLFILFIGTLLSCSSSDNDESTSIGEWTAITPPTNFVGRAAALTHWTGTEMLIWGGEGSNGSLNDGARYNPATDQWALLSSTTAPTHRTDLYNFRDSFTGGSSGHLMVWGGRAVDDYYFSSSATRTNRVDGGIYSLANDSWTNMMAVPTGSPAFAGRAYLNGTWTGNKLLIWSGNDSALDGDGSTTYSFSRNDPAYGSVFDPGTDLNSSADDNWYAMTTTNGPSNRKHPIAIWTGSRLLVWGGAFEESGTVTYFNDGYLYNPGTGVGTDSWTAISTTGAPEGRRFSFYTWTGEKLILWGGLSTGESVVNDGAIYDVATDTWTSMSSNGAPAARSTNSRGIWTGSHFIVFGGAAVDAGFNFTYFRNGGIYDPSTDTWTEIPEETALLPEGLGGSQMVWTGTQLLVWSGWSGSQTYSTMGAALTLNSSFVP